MSARNDVAQLLGRLVGPTGPELGCDECFEMLDRYVELSSPAPIRKRRSRGWARIWRAARPVPRTTTACARFCSAPADWAQRTGRRTSRSG